MIVFYYKFKVIRALEFQGRQTGADVKPTSGIEGSQEWRKVLAAKEMNARKGAKRGRPANRPPLYFNSPTSNRHRRPSSPPPFWEPLLAASAQTR